jgi:pilus assembly protein CpaB
MLVLATALGGGAVFLARGWLQEQMQLNQTPLLQKPQVNLTTIVVAKRPLKFGDRVTREVLNETKWPANTVPAGSFTTIASILGDGKRRVALRAIQINEPVLKDRISGFGGRATLSTVIEKGMRAVTIRVNDVNGVAGFVLPGDRVDILLTRDWSGKGGGRGGNKITNVLMQNIKVLGIDQLANSEKDQPKVARSVTMEVTIDQSQKLALASQVGSLSLTLRNMTNTDPTVHRMVRVRDLVDDSLIKRKREIAKKKVKVRKTRRAVRKKANPFANVKVVRGTKASVQEVVSEKAPERGTIRSYPAPTNLPDATNPPSPAIGQTVDAPAIEPRKATSGPIRLTPDSAVSADRVSNTIKEESSQMPLAKAEESRKGATGAAK